MNRDVTLDEAYAVVLDLDSNVPCPSCAAEWKVSDQPAYAQMMEHDVECVISDSKSQVQQAKTYRHEMHANG